MIREDVYRSYTLREYSLVLFDRKGHVTSECAISLYTRCILAAGDSIFAIGSEPIFEEGSDYPNEGLPYLSRLDSGGGPLWSIQYQHSYVSMSFSTVRIVPVSDC